jgi:precorrin isomerase
VTTTAERLQAVRVKIDSARDAVEGDKGASPVLVAVVNEFAKKRTRLLRSPMSA